MNLLSQLMLLLILISFDFYILLFLLRLMFQVTDVDAFNPIHKFAITLTEYFLKPLRKILPVKKNIDIPLWIGLISFEMIKLILDVWLRISAMPNVLGIIIWGIGDLLVQLNNIISFALVIVVLMSFFNPNSYNPLVNILYRITDPLLRLARRYIPLVSGIDLSPMVIFIALRIISITIVNPLTIWGMKLAVGG